MNNRGRTLQSAKYLKKKRKKTVVVVFLSILSVVLILTSLILVLRLPYFKVSSMRVSGLSTLNANEIKQKALSSLEGDFLWYIPNSSYFFLSKNNIKKDLINSYKQIKTIEIKREDLSTLDILITERTPDAIVCDGFKDDEGNHCYYVDRNAYIFRKAASSTDQFYFKYYMGSDSNTLNVGDSFIDSKKFRELQTFEENINNSLISTSGILISSNGSYELYIKNVDQSVALVYFDDRTPLDRSASNLIAFWQNAMNKKMGTRAVPIFDYINIEYGNNIFYLTK